MSHATHPDQSLYAMRSAARSSPGAALPAKNEPASGGAPADEVTLAFRQAPRPRARTAATTTRTSAGILLFIVRLPRFFSVSAGRMRALGEHLVDRFQELVSVGRFRNVSVNLVTRRQFP